MKKKILSLFLALAMCLSLLPTAAFAADGAQDPAEPGEEILAPEQPEEPEKGSDPEQEEQQADPSVKQDEAVAAVQAMIDDLPDAEELDGMDDEALDAVYEAFQTACDAYYDALTEEQQAQLKNTEKLAALSDWFSQSAALAVETHEHYLCGGTECNGEGHEQEGKKTTFEPWTGSATTTGGAYYLTGDVYGFTVPEGVNLTLCLNGFSIISGSEGSVITVKPGATFTLCNCKGGDCYIGHFRNVYGAGVFVGEKDDSGVSSGENDAKFYMYGGTIGSNRDTEAGYDYTFGSGVVVMGGTFYMYGGKITNNSVDASDYNHSYGGGVSVFNNGTFNMSGGEITGNMSKNGGGGVSVGLGVGIEHAQNKTGGTFTMSGGRIYNNAATYKAGGVYVGCGSDTIFTVSGSAQITDNYLGSLYTRGADNNVYLTEGSEKYKVEDAIIKVGTLDSSASIGVTTEKGEQIVATGVSEAAAKRCFFSDDSTRRLQYDSAAKTLTMVASAHEDHPICGASCTHNNEHPAITNWKGVANLRTISRSGNYYLTGNVTLTEGWVCRYDVTLCLNGYSIIANGDVDAITVGAGKTFTLCDCVGGGEISHTEGKTGRGVKVQGMFNLYGGAITGNKCSTSSSYGSGVYVDSGACFNMHGGSITGNENTVSRYGYGGGVYVNGSTFNMTGGSITKNTATYGAGVWTNVSFTVSGAAKIIDNSKDNAASNVYLAFNPSITIGGGGLDKDARIGVTTGDIKSGEYVTVATGAANSCTADNFSADKGGELGIKVEQGADADSVNVNLYNGLHEHPICGEMCTDGAHTENLTWTGVDDLSKITANEDGTTAYYYLTQDVTRTASWTAPNNVALCLNGYSIVSTPTTQYSNVITVNGTFTLTDCNGSKSVRYFTKNSSSGRWVSASEGADGALPVSGGVIFSNSSYYSTRGMSLGNNSTFRMYGGTICGNSGGVYVTDGAAMTVSGNATITGNAGDLNYNVYLNGVITVGGKLGADAKIGVTTAGTNISAGNYETVAQSADGSALTDDDKEHFESDMGYTPQIRNGKIVFVNGVLHEHPLCGATCAHAGDEKHTENLLWEPLTSKNGVLYYGGSSAGIETAYKSTNYYYLRAGNYYLAEDITTDLPILISGNVNLCLNGKTLSTNKALPTDDTFIAFIAVYENRTLTLCDCDTENKGTIRTETNLSCGVNTWYPFKENTGHTGGNFTMYGGTITGAQRGVRLCVETNGGKSTFKMYGGKITGTKRGVYINDGSIFEMYGGEITGNDTKPTSKEDSTTFGGGVVVDIGATFTMHGGTISNNNAYSGGGVCLLGKSGSATTTFNMEGGTITGNTTSDGGGGGVYLGTNTAFNMSGDASVSGNTAGGSCGGGVYVPTSSSFTMSGNSTISGNTTKYGGGVYVAGGTFNMSENAAIFGNNAGRDKYAGEGGGVCVSTGTFNMTGGSITGNNVYLGSEAPEGEGGGGVYVARNATVNVSGNVQITGNWQNGTKNGDVYEKGETGSDNNLYLYAYKDDSVLKTVTIGGDLTGAKIGVTTRYTPEEKGSILIATGAPTDHAKFFTPDVTGQGYTITQEGEKLYLSAHTHHWKYENSSSAAIKVTCDAPGCNLKSGFEVTYTLTAPAEDTLTYDGNGKPATVVRSAVELPNGVSLPEPSAISYTQTKPTLQQLEATAVPTNAGTYTASITMGSVTASVTYAIAKATPTADDFTFTPPTSLTYDGSPKTATVTSTKIDASYVTVKYYQGETKVSDPTNAGTYTVKIDVTESGNYTAKADLTDENWAFTILKGTYNGTTTPKTIDIVKGRSIAQTGSLTVTDFFAAETELPAGAKIASVTPASGAMMASVTVNDGTLAYTSATGITATADETYTVTISTTNYKDITATLTFHPVEKQPQTSFAFEESAKTVAYGDDNVVVKATGQVAGSKVTYSSEDETVAVVDENTGAVVILKASTTPITIKATASATEKYAEKEISCTLTVSPKTLTADDLEFTANSTFTKEYDGTTNCTTATVQIKSVAKVNSGDALPEVKGAYAYDSKDATGATKVTFTTERTENTNYILPAGLTVEHKASITQRVLTVGTVTATSKQYDGETDAEACIASVPLNGVVDGDSLELDTPTTDGSYYFTADFIDANAGQNKTINGTVVLYPNNVTANYTFKDAQGNETNEATFTTTGAIAKADSWALTPVTDLTIRYNNRAEQTYTPDWPKLLPAGQKWTYNLEDTKVTGSAVLADHSIGADSGVLTYQLSAGAENDTVTWTITASCNNYESFTLTVKLTLIARNEQTGFAFKDVVDGKVTKTYGDADFTITATGAATNSSVTYESSDETVATVDSTGKVTIKGAGTATITAKASATPDYEEKEISYTLTVNKLRIPVPTKGTNELEYTGHEQTYLPDGLDPIYCTIESNKATNVIAGGSWHNADVSLKDRSNTEWADGADSTAHRPYPFRITPKPVTVTALDKKITAGQPAPELTSADYTVTGLIGNDTLGGISLYYADPSDLSKAVTPDTGKAGTYAIVITEGGTGNNNYAPTFVNGTLTIASRPSGGVVAVTYPVNVPGETERGSVSSNVKNASKGSTVTITVEPEDGFQLADLTVTDKDGNELPLTDKGDGKYTFTMPAGKVEVNATFAEKIETSPFADVSTDAYYYEAVKWAAEQGITGGVGGGLFAPDQSCTRAQIVTFLWRAAGSPEPKSMRSFSDVPEDSYYAKAVAWAVENGITVGTSATTFSPDATCTRAQGVTFLFRAAKASADGAPAFRDVAADAYYAAAVKWATDNSVTNGIGGGLFGSDNDCTRAQIVTFLWRLYAGK